MLRTRTQPSSRRGSTASLGPTLDLRNIPSGGLLNRNRSSRAASIASLPVLPSQQRLQNQIVTPPIISGAPRAVTRNTGISVPTPIRGLSRRETESTPTIPRHPLDEDIGPSLPSSIPTQIPRSSRVSGEEGAGSLPKKLVREFEQLQTAHPYVPYGAYVKRQAEELMQRSKRGQRQPGQPWNLTNTFSDDELRLILTDRNFAKKMLKAYDPAFKNVNPTTEDITRFMTVVNQDQGSRLYSQVEIGHNFPPLSQDISSRVREASEARIARHADLASRANLMLGQSSRLAPLSQLHTTARGLLEGNNPQETIDQGRREIAASGRTDIPREIAPYLAQASQTPEAFIRQYEVNYAPVIENFRREAARDFLERDLPTINNQFASRGAFYSGAREAALNKARERKERRIEDEISRLLVHGREEAMRNYHQSRSGHLRQAEIAGHAHQAQQEGRLGAAKALQESVATGQGALHHQLSALNQMGRTEQQQAQNELNVRQQEHREAMERPFMQHMRKAAIAKGGPHPQLYLSPESINPPPPSVYGLASGLLGQMTGLAGQQPPTQAHAKGGHVRKKYAAGDSVSRAAAQLQEMRQHIPETPEEAEMRQSAQAFKNYRANPMADYLFAAGSHQLANLNGSPMESFGQGSQLGMQAFKAAQGANLSAQEKYHNLMSKINQSKMYQRDFLSKHHNSMQRHEEMMRHHMAQEGETRRAHDIMGSRSMINRPVKISATERKLENDAKKDILRALRMKNEVGRLSGLIKQTSTGPVVGGIKSILPKTKIDNQIEVGTNKLILDMHQGMKNIPRSEEFLKRIESTKPNRSNYPEANEEALNLMNQGAEDVLDHSISTLLSAGWTPEKIEKQFKIKIPQHLLDEEEEDVDHTSETSEEDNIISMVDPEGNPLAVPLSQVEEALSLGATVAQ